MLKTLLSGLVFIILSYFSYAQESLNKKLSIVLHERTLPETFIELQKRSNINFAFDPNSIPADLRVNKRYTNATLRFILSDLLLNTPLTFSYVANQIVIAKRKVQYVTVDGFITDEKSGEPLIEANISVPLLGISTATNQYGFFSLTLPAGVHTFLISHVEYLKEKFEIPVYENKRLSTVLKYRENQLADVVVGSTPKPDSVNVRLGIKSITNEQLNKLNYYAGEVDVIKALQMQDGVKALTEGSSAMFVRGGNNDQNLIMLDEALIYNPSHLFGLVSIFNSDAIKNVQLYKDFIPASLGGRLSSVLDARMAEGNNQHFHLKAGISLLSMRVAVEGPLQKQKGSFILTFRRSLIDLLNKDYRLLNPNSTYEDVNVKANYQLNKNNKVFFSFYGGDDKLFSENSFRNNWGNITSTVRWNHVFNSRLFFNLSAIYSNYKNSLDLNSDTVTQKQVWDTGIEDKTLKTDFTYYLRPGNEIKFGSLITRHIFVPGRIKTSISQEPNIPESKAWESACYVSHRYSLKNRLNVVYGLRLSTFYNSEEVFGVYDPDENLLKVRSRVFYWRPEPRLYAAYKMAPNHSIHATYNRNFQYLQLVQNSELAFSSLETWMPASKVTQPQSVHHTSIGYNWQPLKFSFSASTYYKRFFNQVELLDHAQIIQNPEIRRYLRYGRSEAYGIEFSLSKTIGKLSTETGYTWSRVLKRIDGINDNRWYRANYDIPHEFKTSWMYRFNERFRLNTFFIWASGRPSTQPVGFYYQDGIQVPVFEKRNNARFPDFNRLDVALRYSVSGRQKGVNQWRQYFSLGIYNVYNKKNPLYYRLLQGTDSNHLGIINSSTQILPWLAYSFQF